MNWPKLQKTIFNLSSFFWDNTVGYFIKRVNY